MLSEKYKKIIVSELNKIYAECAKDNFDMIKAIREISPEKISDQEFVENATRHENEYSNFADTLANCAISAAGENVKLNSISDIINKDEDTETAKEYVDLLSAYLNKYFNGQNEQEVGAKITTLNLLQLIPKLDSMKDCINLLERTSLNNESFSPYKEALKEYVENRFLGEVEFHEGDISLEDLGL